MQRRAVLMMVVFGFLTGGLMFEAAAAAPRGSITATATLGGKKLIGVPVTLKRNGSSYQTLATDRYGRVTFSKLPAGVYEVSCSYRSGNARYYVAERNTFSGPIANAGRPTSRSSVSANRRALDQAPGRSIERFS